MLHFFLAILILAPLAYGTTGPWAKLVIQGSLFLLLLAWAFSGARGRRRVYRIPGLLPLLVLAGFLLLQCLPLPPGVLKFLAPAAWQHYAEGIWLLEPGRWLPLSVDLRASLHEVLQICSGIAAYVLAVQLLDRREALRRVMLVVVWFAPLYALVSIVYHLFPNGRILWFFHPWPPGVDQQFGTYVNGSHYAGLMGMLLLPCIAWFLAHRPQVSYSRFKEKLVDFFNDPQASPHLLYGLGALLVAVSIFISQSRGGILSCLGALLVFGLLLALRGFDRRRGLIFACFFALLLAGVGIFGWEPIFADFARLRGADGSLQEVRPEYWRDAGAMLSDYPLGTGIGTFNSAYRGYQTVFSGDHVVDHAHNDYVEWATDTGLPGSILLVAALLAILRAGWRGLRRRRTLLSNYLGLGCLAGLVSIALHSLTDFNLHIGANVLWFGFLAGLLMAAAMTRSREGRTSSDLQVVGCRSGLVALIMAVALLAGHLWLQGGTCAGLLAFAPVEGIKTSQLRESERVPPLLEASLKAATLDPLQADYRFAVGNLALLLGRREEALAGYAAALGLRPLDGEILQQAGLLLDAYGRRKDAGRLLVQASILDRTRPERLRVLGNWQLTHGQTENGLASLKRALALEPGRAREYFTLLILNGLSDRELSAVLPDRSLPWLSYGDYLLQRGMTAAAEQAYRRALDFAAAERSGSAAYHRVARYYARNKELDLALQVIAKGLEVLGGDASLYRAAGQYYRLAGLELQAREAFEKAVLLNPRDKWARKQLALLKGETP